MQLTKFQKPFHLYTSATLKGVSALLAQNDDDGKERPVYYISYTLLDYETIYTNLER